MNGPALAEILTSLITGDYTDQPAIPVVDITTPAGEPSGWLQHGDDRYPRPGDLMSLAGIMLTGSDLTRARCIRVAVADGKDGDVLITGFRYPSGPHGGLEGEYQAWRRGKDGMARCCTPDPDLQEACGSFPEPWCGHCAAHQTPEDAARRLAAWREASYRVRDERDPAVRAAHAAGMNKHQIYLATTLARTTIDSVLAGGETAGGAS